jgi:hypothetical protein
LSTTINVDPEYSGARLFTVSPDKTMGIVKMIIFLNVVGRILVFLLPANDTCSQAF